MSYTIAEAAKAVGKNKTTIFRAIKNGIISGTKDALGQYRIDPAELHRVYERTDAPKEVVHETQQRATADAAVFEAQIQALKELATAYKTQLDDVRSDRDQWRQQCDHWQEALKTEQHKSEQLLLAHQPRPQTASNSLFGWFKRAG